MDHDIRNLQKENDQLKYIIASSDMPCIYCQLPKADINRCKSGFPGCGRMDDSTWGDIVYAEPVAS